VNEAAFRSGGESTVIGTTLNQRFILEMELGRGGMGVVYRATDQVLNRTVAIKVLKEQTGDQVGRKIRLEAQILARLLHENVVRLYDFGESDGIYHLIMEEVSGASYSKRWKQVPMVERLRIAAQVADALDYAHHQGVIHRDVKPANVLLTASDQVKLSDFGLSQIAEQHSESGTVRGTPHYMSPEQVRGKSLDRRSDLYSLGVMLYESATGAPPFLGPPLAIMSQHIKEAPEPPRVRNPAITTTLEGLILRLLAKDPAGRPASGKLVAEALRDEIARLQPASTAGPIVIDAPILQVSADAPTVAAPTQPVTTPTVMTAPTAATAIAPSAATTIAPAAPTTTTTNLSSITLRATPPLVREMLDSILAEPIELSPDERYLCGHYLAYMLGGAQRRGPLLRRKLDPRNADRARLLLGLTAAMVADGSDAAIAQAAELLEMRHEVRPLLNPMVVMTYLGCRDTPAKRKRLRQIRKQIQEASPYAQRRMTDANGALNPGLIPQSLDDLRQIAPDRTEMDDDLVGRWNRLGEVWRSNPSFREAVLRYATRSAAGHPASAELWPEVVYPLIARARWQRRHRPPAEALQDFLFDRVLRAPNPGLRFDRAFRVAVPEPVVAKLDISLDALGNNSAIEVELSAPAVSHNRDRDFDPESALSLRSGISLQNLPNDLTDDLTSETVKTKGLIHLVNPDPLRFLQGELRDLWQEAVSALHTPGLKKSHRHVPIGPYRLTVVPSVRGRSAGQVAIQGMPNKQIEMLIPSFRTAGSARKPIIAAWFYEDSSLVLVHLDFRGVERYILWHASSGLQSNYSTAAALNHDLYHLGLEAPDQLDRVLSKRFLPRNTV
jgi:serine/threonine protein kinase